MTRKELIVRVAEASGLPREQAKAAVEATLQAIAEALARGQPVRLTGFGAFSRVERPAGLARNPKTGQSVWAPASRSVRFRAGEGLKSLLNG